MRFNLVFDQQRHIKYKPYQYDAPIINESKLIVTTSNTGKLNIYQLVYWF